MNEEEIIERLTNRKKYSLIEIIRKFKREGIENFLITKPELVQGLLDLYNKEKEKNKELEKYEKYYQTEKVVWSRKDYISKDKIREKIKELEKEIEKINNKNDGYWEDTSIILDKQKQFLQELLEEGDDK